MSLIRVVRPTKAILAAATIAALAACGSTHDTAATRTAFVFNTGIYDPVVVCPTSQPVERDGDLVTIHCDDRGDISTSGHIVIADGHAEWDADLARITTTQAP